MLFGRKTPPTATPKPEATPPEAQPPAQPEAAAPVDPAPQPQPQPTPQPTPPRAASPFPTSPQPAPAPTYRPPFSDKDPEMTTTPKPPVPPTTPSASFKPSDIPRRTVDIPGVTPRRPDGLATPAAPVAPTPTPAPIPAAASPEQRRLVVGRDISLTGEIGSCDVLVVEGTVEAKLRNGRSIEIADGGLFKGSVEIEEADIGGRFEGDIAVRGRLTVRATGKITGTIKYRELSVEAGGQLVGEIQSVTPESLAKPVPAAVPAEGE